MNYNQKYTSNAKDQKKRTTKNSLWENIVFHLSRVVKFHQITTVLGKHRIQSFGNFSKISE